MKITSGAACVSLALLAAIPVHAQESGTMHGMQHGGMDAVEKAMDEMMADMHAIEPTGDPDADFLLMMIPHHQSAVDMARALLPEIDDPEVEDLARTVISSQEAEIAAMHEMLERLGPSAETADR